MDLIWWPIEFIFIVLCVCFFFTIFTHYKVKNLLLKIIFIPGIHKKLLKRPKMIWLGVSRGKRFQAVIYWVAQKCLVRWKKYFCAKSCRLYTIHTYYKFSVRNKRLKQKIVQLWTYFRSLLSGVVPDFCGVLANIRSDKRTACPIYCAQKNL